MTTADLALAAVMAVIGLVVGSFVNLVAMRLPKDEPIALARSRAECCGVTLSAWELAPVVSWLVHRGRCARCGAAVSARHPLVELAGAGIGAWSVFATAGPIEAMAGAIFGWQLLLIALVDADEMWLPDRLTLPLLLSGLAAAAILPGVTLVNAAIGAAVGFIVLWAVATVYRRLRSREGLGGGDPILFAALGAWVGWMGLPSVLLWACAAGLSWVGARALVRRALDRDQPLPFGPFLAVGGWLTWLYGPLGLG